MFRGMWRHRVVGGPRKQAKPSDLELASLRNLHLNICLLSLTNRLGTGASGKMFRIRIPSTMSGIHMTQLPSPRNIYIYIYVFPKNSMGYEPLCALSAALCSVHKMIPGAHRVYGYAAHLREQRP